MSSSRIIIRIVIGATLGAIVSIVFFLSAPSFERLEREFYRSYEHFVIVRDFLSEQDETHALLTRDGRIRAPWILGFLGVNPTLTAIEDAEVISSIRILRQRGFSWGYRARYGIVFQRNHFSFETWSSHGVVYFMDGRGPDDSRVFLYLTALEPLSKSGWYVFAESGTEYWRRIESAREEFFAEPVPDWIEDELQHNIELLTVAKDFLSMSESRRVHVDSRILSTNEIRQDGVDVLIEDEKSLHALHSLMARGYTSIGKSDGVISFRRWCSLRYFDYGMLYAVDGSLPHYDIPPEFRVMTKPLSKEGWYFFICSAEMWVEMWMPIIDDLRANFFAEPDLGFIEEGFYTSREYIYMARDFLLEQNYLEILISSGDIYFERMRISEIDEEGWWQRSDSPLEDEKAIAVFNTLIFDRGYWIIQRRYDSIVFTRSKHNFGSDFSYGFIYSSNLDELSPFSGSGVLFRLVILEPAQEENWYFFVQDREEWNRRNPN